MEENEILNYLSNLYTENMCTLENLNASYPSEDEMETISSNTSHSKEMRNTRIKSKLSKKISEMKKQINVKEEPASHDFNIQSQPAKYRKIEIPYTENFFQKREKLKKVETSAQSSLSSLQNEQVQIVTCENTVTSALLNMSTLNCNAGISKENTESASQLKTSEIPNHFTVGAPLPSIISTFKNNLLTSVISSVNTEKNMSASQSQVSKKLSEAPPFLKVGVSSQSNIATTSQQTSKLTNYASVGNPTVFSASPQITTKLTESPNIGVSLTTTTPAIRLTDQIPVLKDGKGEKSSLITSSQSDFTTKLYNAENSPQLSTPSEIFSEQRLASKDANNKKTIAENVKVTNNFDSQSIKFSPRTSICTVQTTQQNPLPINVSKLSMASTSAPDPRPLFVGLRANMYSGHLTKVTLVPKYVTVGATLPSMSNRLPLSLNQQANKLVPKTSPSSSTCTQNDMQVSEISSTFQSNISVETEKQLHEKYKKHLKSLKQKKIKEEITKIAQGESVRIKFSALYNLKKLDKKDVLLWCMDMGLFFSQPKCRVCGKNMVLIERTDCADKYVWSCRENMKDSEHYTRLSVRLKSFLHRTHIGVEDALMLIHCWIYKVPHEWICSELPKVTKNIEQWENFCRNVCTEMCAREDCKIGGVGKVVEIEGKVFEKYKNEIEHKWIITGLEDAYTDKYFFRIVKEYNKKSFLETVKTSVLPGTTIVSNFCSSYSDLLNKDLIDSDNFSTYEFVDWENTSIKKKSWAYITRQFPEQGKRSKKFNNYICEYTWRKKNSLVFDKMRKFLSDMKLIYPLTVSDKD